MTRILVSACFIGACCRYDGRSNEKEGVLHLLEREDVELVPVCPEQLGGLPTPRVPSECLDGRVVNQIGQDVTAQFERGAGEALKFFHLYGCEAALLKEKSPSCGFGKIYDGTFSHTLIPGDGKTAALLRQEQIPVFGETKLHDLLSYLDQTK